MGISWIWETGSKQSSSSDKEAAGREKTYKMEERQVTVSVV